MLFALVWYVTRPGEGIDKEKGPDRIAHKNVVPKHNGKRVLNLPPGHEKETLDNLHVSNTVSEDWQSKVEVALKLQGGDALKDVSIKKVESLVWIYNGVALNAESIEVTLKNEKGERTSFRAMVDSQNGKILQTWDQPVFDPINPHEKQFGIRVDPRYQND